MDDEDRELARKREERRQSLATEAAKLAQYEKESAEANAARDEAREKVKELERKWAEHLKALEDKSRAIANRREHAAWARNCLLSEFVDRKLIERESQAETAANKAKATRDQALEDVEVRRAEMRRAEKPDPIYRGGKKIAQRPEPERVKFLKREIAKLEAVLRHAEVELQNCVVRRDNLTKELGEAYRQVLRG